MTIQSKSDKLHFTFTTFQCLEKGNHGEPRQMFSEPCKYNFKKLFTEVAFAIKGSKDQELSFNLLQWQCVLVCNLIILQSLNTCQMMPTRNLHFNTNLLIQTKHQHQQERPYAMQWLDHT